MCQSFGGGSVSPTVATRSEHGFYSQSNGAELRLMGAFVFSLWRLRDAVLSLRESERGYSLTLGYT